MTSEQERNRRYAQIGALAHTLRTGTKEGSPERQALARRIVQALVGQGVLSPEAAVQIDVSDAGLLAVEREALTAALQPSAARQSPKKGGRRVRRAENENGGGIDLPPP